MWWGRGRENEKETVGTRSLSKISAESRSDRLETDLDILRTLSENPVESLGREWLCGVGDTSVKFYPFVSQP